MTILAAWMLADFISGLIHWWEDRAIIGTSRFAFINGVREDNERHHQQPGYFLKLSYWENINTTAPIGLTATIILMLIGAPTLWILVTLFLSFGNLIHRWSHEPKAKLPFIVRWLQRIGFFMSFNHHAGHHYVAGRPVSREDSTIRYCVMSNWINPILDKIKFFPVLEIILKFK